MNMLRTISGIFYLFLLYGVAGSVTEPLDIAEKLPGVWALDTSTQTLLGVGPVQLEIRSPNVGEESIISMECDLKTNTPVLFDLAYDLEEEVWNIDVIDGGSRWTSKADDRTAKRTLTRILRKITRVDLIDNQLVLAGKAGTLKFQRAAQNIGLPETTAEEVNSQNVRAERALETEEGDGPEVLFHFSNYMQVQGEKRDQQELTGVLGLSLSNITNHDNSVKADLIFLLGNPNVTDSLRERVYAVDMVEQKLNDTVEENLIDTPSVTVQIENVEIPMESAATTNLDAVNFLDEFMKNASLLDLRTFKTDAEVVLSSGSSVLTFAIGPDYKS